MTFKETNHICKNAHCPNGKNGEPKHYYTCDYCDRSNQWKSLACSIECYEEYVKQVIEARNANNVVNIKPVRTDLTENEVDELMVTPIEEVLEKTKEELKEYTTDENGEIITSISEAVTKINEEIDAEETATTNSIVNNYSYSKKKKNK